MATELAKAYVQIIPSAEGIKGGIQKVLEPEAESAGKTAGLKLSNALGTASKIGVTAVAGLTTAIAGIGTTLVSSAKSTADYGDTIDKMSQKLGISAKSYQEWDHVMNLAGTSMANMGTGMKTLTNKLDDAKNGSASAQEMFTKLGLSLDDLQNMSREDVFGAVITGFQGMEDSIDRAALANDLFGKSGQELTPLFNMTAEESRKAIENINELGGVMSNEAVKQSAEFTDSLTVLSTAFTGMQNSLTANFLPSLTMVTDGLAKVISGDDSGLKGINKGISQLVDNLAKMIPEVAKSAMGILRNLAEAIIQNIPQLASTATDILIGLVDMIIDNLPTIIKAGVQILVSLANGIVKALPELIPATIDAILEITDALIDNVDLLIDGAIALVVGLAEALIDASPRLIERIPELVIKLVNALINNAPKLATASVKLISSLLTGLINNWTQILSSIPSLISKLVQTFGNFASNMANVGRNLVSGLWNGLRDAWNTLVHNVTNLAGNLISSVKDIFGIHSPSRVFAQIGEFCAEGFDEGFDDFGEGALGQVESVLGDMQDVGNSFDISSANLSRGAMSGARQSNNANYSNNDSAMLNLLSQYLPELGKDTQTNVYLQGDASNIFKVVRQEVNKFSKSTGYSPFAMA